MTGMELTDDLPIDSLPALGHEQGLEMLKNGSDVGKKPLSSRVPTLTNSFEHTANQLLTWLTFSSTMQSCRMGRHIKDARQTSGDVWRS